MDKCTLNWLKIECKTVQTVSVFSLLVGKKFRWRGMVFLLKTCLGERAGATMQGAHSIESRYCKKDFVTLSGVCDHSRNTKHLYKLCNVGPTLKTLGRRCTNVIQSFVLNGILLPTSMVLFHRLKPTN